MFHESQSANVDPIKTPSTRSFAGRRRTRGSTRRLASWIAVVLAVPLATLPTATAIHSITEFELDGNAAASPVTAGDDWNSLSAASATTGVLADAAATDTSYFTGKGSLDTLNVNQWRYSAKAVAATDQITDAYAASYLSGGAHNLYFGLDRFAVTQGASVGFWFFQRPIALGANGVFTGVHANGDVFVSATFTKAGALTNIQAFTWQGGVLVGPASSGAECLPASTAGNECGIVNKSPQSSLWAYTPKSGPAGTFPTSAFFEGAINLTALPSGGTCFSSFLAETRSSQASNAPLQDFRLGTLPPTCRAEIGIDPQHALNLVGTIHQLTVNVSKDTGSGFVAAAGVTVTAALPSGPGTFVGPNTCLTNAVGTCTVNITSSVPGITIVSASGTVMVVGASVAVATDGVIPNSGPASKTWVMPTVGTSTVTSPSAALLAFGDSVRDLARVEDENGDPVPVGNVTFYICSVGGGLCGSGGLQVGSPVSLADGYANSTFLTPDAIGSYCFRAVYGGATTATKTFNPSTDANANECFDVDAGATSIVSAPSSASIQLGDSVYDTAAVAGLGAGFPTPTGNVTFYIDGVQIGLPVDLDGSGLASSNTVTPVASGSYCFKADYSGDGTYAASSDASASECFQVGPASSTTATTPSGAVITVGDQISDHAVVTGLGPAFPAPTGTVTFYLDDVQIGIPVLLNSTGQADSISVTPVSTGAHCFRANYSGDANYQASNDALANECFTVQGTGATATNTTITITPNPANVLELVHFDARVLDADGNPVTVGAVTFGLCFNEVPCLGGFDIASIPVNALGTASINVQFGDPGQYCWSATYSGFVGTPSYATSADRTLNGCVTVEA